MTSGKSGADVHPGPHGGDATV